MVLGVRSEIEMATKNAFETVLNRIADLVVARNNGSPDPANIANAMKACVPQTVKERDWLLGHSDEHFDAVVSIWGECDLTIGQYMGDGS